MRGHHNGILNVRRLSRRESTKHYANDKNLGGAPSLSIRQQSHDWLECVQICGNSMF